MNVPASKGTYTLLKIHFYIYIFYILLKIMMGHSTMTYTELYILWDSVSLFFTVFFRLFYYILLESSIGCELIHQWIIHQCSAIDIIQFNNPTTAFFKTIKNFDFTDTHIRKYICPAQSQWVWILHIRVEQKSKTTMRIDIWLTLMRTNNDLVLTLTATLNVSGGILAPTICVATYK